MTPKERKRPLRKPDWLKVPLGQGPRMNALQRIVDGGRLHTVCDEALCPNKGRCWQHGHATLMILGDRCTRGCPFCSVQSECDGTVDAEEPRRVAEAVKDMKLWDVVITSVTRDDLPDGGAAIWAETIERIRDAVPGVTIEVLVPDFGGNEDALRIVTDSTPEVFGHNLEAPAELYPRVRPQADYARSLRLLEQATALGMLTKSSIMVGLGETEPQVLQTMRDARQAGCEIFYLGQYMQPTRDHLDVERYVEPSEFDAYKQAGLEMGFGVVVSEPLVRSSFHSEEQERYVEEWHSENV